ncbi:hypothetical protein [Lysinibacter sp. HNR]|uniref:RCC1 domain-containing protein n=1 Tax=Lysinibacter sp. HNR TaxID=3031408 RepID=UPI00243490AC|nr:hypothetical protein [Lysinibacter sp. HNR]WGD36551.1 hypothetical protein FrondiHNR_08725 [Lysinibacter sp. HNR]
MSQLHLSRTPRHPVSKTRLLSNQVIGRVPRNVIRTLMIAGIVIGLSVAGYGKTYAAPIPNSGSVTGGTTVTNSAPPVFTEISPGGLHSIAFGSDSNLYGWGGNWMGQLGDGTTTDRSSPVPVQTPPGVTYTRVGAAGGAFSLAFGSDGNLYGWGTNGFGQLGNGTNTNSSTPVQVINPPGVTYTQVVAGDRHSLAFGDDGNLYAWGENGFGQLGDGTTTDRSSPVPVQTPPGVSYTQVVAGGFFSLALGSDGNLYAWGSNWTGQLGNGTNIDSAEPVQVQTPPSITYTQLAAGELFALALDDAGNLYAWGNNLLGQLGDGTTTDSFQPVRAETPPGVEYDRVVAGGTQAFAFGNDGNLYGWGSNGFGQLGNGSTINSSTPVRVQTPPGASSARAGVAAQAGVSYLQVGVGTSHALALASDGNLYAWGNNLLRQLGNGTTTNSSIPAQVIGEVSVMGVTFGGVPGTDLSVGGGTWSVVTPPHAPGPVDVRVQWSRNSLSQPDIVIPGGFTYIAPLLTVSDPADVTIAAGEYALFAVVIGGTDSSGVDVQWQVLPVGDIVWENISADPHATTSADGLTLTLTRVPLERNGYQYRAVATDANQSVTSLPATLTVTQGGANGDPKILADTGGRTPIDSLVSGALLLIAGAGILMTQHLRRGFGKA